jgi:hypothetical protein
MGKSLLEGINSVASSASRGKSGSGNTWKLGLAIGLFVIAAGLFLWQFGLFSSTEKVEVKVTPEQQKASQEHEATVKKQIETHQVIQSGS